MWTTSSHNRSNVQPIKTHGKVAALDTATKRRIAGPFGRAAGMFSCGFVPHDPRGAVRIKHFRLTNWKFARRFKKANHTKMPINNTFSTLKHVQRAFIATTPLSLWSPLSGKAFRANGWQCISAALAPPLVSTHHDVDTASQLCETTTQDSTEHHSAIDTVTRVLVANVELTASLREARQLVRPPKRVHTGTERRRSKLRN
jgi:hypothetical protein